MPMTLPPTRIYAYRLFHKTANHQFVGQQPRKRFVADDLSRASYCTAVSQRLLLAGIDQLPGFCGCPRLPTATCPAPS